MPEAIMILLDNSDYSINGDYTPTRWLSETDAAGLLIQTKMDYSHENVVGLQLMAGKQVQVICSLSNDIGRVSSALYGVKQHGMLKLCLSLQTATLALKHRGEQAARQRIVVFIASTITDSLEELMYICKKLKKNGIALDILALGDLSKEQREKLHAMHEVVTQDGNSNIAFIEQTLNISDVMLSTNMLSEPHQPAFAQADDPELFLALQLSLQEAQREGGESRNEDV